MCRCIVNCMYWSLMYCVVNWRDGCNRGMCCMNWGGGRVRCVKRSHCCMVSCKMGKPWVMMNCRVWHNWGWMGASDRAMGGVMWSNCSVRSQHWGVMRSSQSLSGVIWSVMRVNSCVVDCMMCCMMRGRGGMMRRNNCMMCCMMWSSNCMVCCMMWSHSMRQLSMSGVTGLDDLRRRPDLSRWLTTRV